MKRTCIGLVIAVMTSVGMGNAVAQPGTVPTQQFQPPAGGDENFIGLMGHDVLGHMQTSFGLYLNYAYKPLEFTMEPMGVSTCLVRNQFAGDFLAAVGLFDALELGLAVPTTFYQNADGNALKLARASIEHVTVGDLRLVPKWRFFHRANQGGLALAAVVSLPTGDEESMQGNRTVTVEPRLIFDWYLHPRFRMSANAGFLLRAQQGLFNVDVGNEFTYGVAVDWRAVPETLAVIGEVAGKMAADADSVIEEETVPLEALAGLRLMTRSGHSFTLAGGPGLTNGYGTPTYRVALGYTYTGPMDRDGDGCYDREDPCPDDPEDRDGFEDADCCPDADNDQDGICDPWVADQNRGEQYAALCHGRDQCPDVPEDRDGFEDEDGCPDPDNDNDRICDPWVADQNRGQQYATLCRGRDQCPDVPEDRDGFEDEDGCPDPDNDRDKICDPWVADLSQTAKYADVCRLRDICPDVPENINGIDDDDGCPETKDALARIEGKKIVILDVILFYFDKTVIKPESHAVIDAVVKVLQDNPQIRKVRIEGHTDRHGSDAYNVRLSTGRAKAVQTYLIRNGIEASRLTFEGFGERRPLVSPERSPADSQKNRRVEFIILESDDQP